MMPDVSQCSLTREYRASSKVSETPHEKRNDIVQMQSMFLVITNNLIKHTTNEEEHNGKNQFLEITYAAFRIFWSKHAKRSQHPIIRIV